MIVSMTVPQMRRHECTIDGTVVRLPPQVADLLALLLMRSPDDIVDRATIIEAIWPNPDLQPLTATIAIRVYVAALRRIGVPVETIGHSKGCRGWRIPVEARGSDAPAQRLAA
jgi:DNA-binding response OmpR family regulator